MGLSLKEKCTHRKSYGIIGTCQHTLCPMASVVVAEPHAAELSPHGGIVTGVVTEEVLKHTIRGVVVVAVTWDMVKYYNKSSNKQWLPST